MRLSAESEIINGWGVEEWCEPDLVVVQFGSRVRPAKREILRYA